MSVLRTLVLALLVGGVSAPAAAADSAELKRLQTELHTLARRSTWSGVDRTYRSLVALGEPLSNEDHVAGYQAARQLGDILLALHRIRRVAPPEEGGEDPSWDEAQRILEGLPQQFGLVAIVVPEGRSPVIERPAMPFAPDQRAAVERAQEVLKEHRELRALLPVGSYLVDGTALEVAPGPRWQELVLEPR